MFPMDKDRRELHRKLCILEQVNKIGSVVVRCRYIGIGRSSFYRR
jgi:hypothetical protein